MPLDLPTNNTARDLSRSRWRAQHRGLLPSWFFSIWFHIVLLVVAAWGLRSLTGQGDRGESDTKWRTVGLVMRTNPSDAKPSPEQNASAIESIENPDQQVFEASTAPQVETNPFQPSETVLPKTSTSDFPSVLGPGRAMPKFGAPEASPGEIPAGKSRIATGPIAPAGLARGETDFFGIRDKAKQLVYVIDISGSMASPPSAIRSAKSELLASLATLTNEQQFQVIFFNERADLLRIKGYRPGEMIPATDINRTLAGQEVAATRPNLGTRPMPALKKALALEPDVIFFLTDAESGALSYAEIEKITRLNDGQSRIHAIQFGEGDRLGASSSMEQLAAHNGGAFEYHDVNQGKR